MNLGSGSPSRHTFWTTFSLLKSIWVGGSPLSLGMPKRKVFSSSGKAFQKQHSFVPSYLRIFICFLFLCVIKSCSRVARNYNVVKLEERRHVFLCISMCLNHLYLCGEKWSCGQVGASEAAQRRRWVRRREQRCRQNLSRLTCGFIFWLKCKLFSPKRFALIRAF